MDTETECHANEFEHSVEYFVQIADIIPSSQLPFPLLPYEWYLKQGKLFQANQVRSQHHKDTPILHSTLLPSLNRSKVLCTINENIKLLQDSIDSLQLHKFHSKVKHLKKCLKVGIYIR